MSFLFRLLALMPLRLLHALGAVAGWLVWLASPSYRRRHAENARQGSASAAQRRQAVASAGRMVAEIPWLWLAPADRPVSPRVQWQGREALDAAVAGGRGVLLLTPHLGSFELVGQAYAEAYGDTAPMTAMYRPARQPWLREFQERSRRRPGLLTAPASVAGVRQMLRALRHGHTVGLLPDQVPPEGLGVWAPFFGRPAYTITLAWRLLELTGAELVLIRCERRPRGQGWVLHVQSAADEVAALRARAAHQAVDAAALELEGARLVNQLMEGLIREGASQYLWGYNRYKQPRRLSA